MRSLVSLASVVLIAASAANCADVPGEANSIGSINPSILAAAPASDAKLTMTATGGKKGKPGAVNPSPDLAVQTVLDADGDGLLSWGDSISIEVLTTDSWNQVEVICSQNGVDVFGSGRTKGVNDQYPIQLSSGMWTGGAADCTASLIVLGQKAPISSLPFTVLE